MPFALLPKALGVGVSLLSGANAFKGLTEQKPEKTPPDEEAGGDHIGSKSSQKDEGLVPDSIPILGKL